MLFEQDELSICNVIYFASTVCAQKMCTEELISRRQTKP